ncbi:MAG: hypothetical protein RL328_28 [Acidobacteriota bacterium]|jgi:ankyrin repeat protein
MSLEDDLLEAFELHSPAGIRKALKRGLSPIARLRGKTPVEHLIEMYTRSPKFAECLRVLLDAGAEIGDSLLRAVLLDDADGLPTDEVNRALDVVSAYTCCRGVTALHLCAEFNSVRCARALLAAGADVNARAALDADGFGGQPPIFHAVNSNGNYCRPMLELLVDAGADLEARLKGLKWGEGFDWETVLFDVTVFSYAQCGLYKQFHRDERDIYGNLALMYERRYGSVAPIRNVPNKYLLS